MVASIEERKQKVTKQTFFLGFRDTIMLCLGLIQREMTRGSLYIIYKKIHAQLTRLNLIGFDLPTQTIFFDMLRKLHKQDIIEEYYADKNYSINLTMQGEASFEVIMSNLQIYPEFKRIINVYDFYNNST